MRIIIFHTTCICIYYIRYHKLISLKFNVSVFAARLVSIIRNFFLYSWTVLKPAAIHFLHLKPRHNFIKWFQRFIYLFICFYLSAADKKHHLPNSQSRVSACELQYAPYITIKLGPKTTRALNFHCVDFFRFRKGNSPTHPALVRRGS